MSDNILEYIRKHQEADRLLLLTNAACGLEHLHSLEIVHGGINPGNILINGQGIACIGDFEIAGIITNPTVTAQCSATTCRPGIVRYMAPEQVNPGRFNLTRSNATKETDVHSFAMTSYEVFTGIEPYEGITGDGPLVMQIISEARPPRPTDEIAAGRFSGAVWKMMESCWAPIPVSRPSIKAVYRVFHRSIAKADGPTPKGEKPPQNDTGQPPRMGVLLDLPGPQRIQPVKRGFLDKIRRLVFSR